MKRNLLSFLWLFAFFCSVGCDSNTDPSFESVDTVSIGVILPQTVPGPLQHEAEYAAIQLAIERVNEYLSENAPEKRVLAQIRDSRYSTEDILEALEDFVEMGIKVAVFSGLSSNLDNVKEFVHENGILIINQSSTATLLSEADNIFRLVPDDDYLSEVLAGVFTPDPAVVC